MFVSSFDIDTFEFTTMKNRFILSSFLILFSVFNALASDSLDPHKKLITPGDSITPLKDRAQVIADSIKEASRPKTPAEIALEQKKAKALKLQHDSILFAKMKKDVYFELGGNGIGASFNYEKLWKAKESFWALRVGVGAFKKNDTLNMIVPLTLGKLLIKKNEFLEVAAGVALYKPVKGGKLNYYLTGLLAYRRNFSNNKYYFKAAFTPYVSIEKGSAKGTVFNLEPFIGVGLGKYLN